MCAYKRSSTLRSVVVGVLSLAISVGGLPAHALAEAIESSQVEVDALSDDTSNESSVVDGLAGAGTLLWAVAFDAHKHVAVARV